MKTKYFGVNVGKTTNGPIQYERYLTFTCFADAKRLFDILILGNEQHLWEFVEIEEIEVSSCDSEDAAYKTVLRAQIVTSSSLYSKIL